MPIFSPDIFDSVGDAIVTGGGTGVSTFVALNDTPASYSGESLKFVRVNVGETALEFVVNSGGASTFVALNDTPSSYITFADHTVQVNSLASGLEFVPKIDAFTDLTDTPSSIVVGDANKNVQVNKLGTAIGFAVPEFVKSKLVVSVSDVAHLKYNDTPLALATPSALERIIPISIVVEAVYPSGFGETSLSDLIFGWDGVASTTTAKFTSVKNMMNGKATGTYVYAPAMGGTVITPFSISGEVFQVWSSGIFNGNWSMDIYFNYSVAK